MISDKESGFSSDDELLQPNKQNPWTIVLHEYIKIYAYHKVMRMKALFHGGVYHYKIIDHTLSKPWNSVVFQQVSVYQKFDGSNPHGSELSPLHLYFQLRKHQHA